MNASHHSPISPHWAAAYIGKPWAPDGFGPEVFSCWGLIRWIYRERYDIDLPEFPIITDPFEIARAMRHQQNIGDWFPIAKPLDGCVVGMSSHQSFHHVGLYIEADGGMVLHACEGKGTICQSIHNLPAHGWNRVAYYLHRQWPTLSK